MHTRQNELNKWLLSVLQDKPYTLTPLAGDASFRRYFRLTCEGLSHIVMDAPPDKETITSFIDIDHLLEANGVHSPAILAVNRAQGFILLEDFGDQLLLNALTRNDADSLYKTAMNLLLTLQECPLSSCQLPDFNQAFMLKEMALFQDWFLDAYLSVSLSPSETSVLKKTFDWLVSEISTQPTVFIHRDYHSRNLMILNRSPIELGVIDFQDAMNGPFTYDLVSLLKDCYIQWPREQVLDWVAYFYQAMPFHHGYSLEAFSRAFDLAGLQRHLKVLGIFCRLHLRDHKASYLRDLPLTFHYVNACTESYPELQAFNQLMQKRIYLPFVEKNPS